MMCFPVLVTSEDEGNLETLSVIVLLLPNKKCLSSLTSLPPPSRMSDSQYVIMSIRQYVRMQLFSLGIKMKVVPNVIKRKL